MTRPLFTAAACAVFMALTAPVTVLADEIRRQITVTGEGSVAVVPDMATINLGVTHQAKEAGAAMSAVSGATAAMLQRLTDLGVDARDMQTSSLSLNPVWSNSSSSTSGNPKITGFLASNSVRVRVLELADLGRIMDAVISSGANDFKGLQFSVQEPDPLMDLARQKAVANAMDKALLLTTAAGVTLGAVQSIAEHGGGRPVMMEMAAARSSSVPIAAGEVTVSASVSMVFAISD